VMVGLIALNALPESAPIKVGLNASRRVGVS